MGKTPYLRAIKATEIIVLGSPLTIFVSHIVEFLLNFHHTQHISVSSLTSYEVLLLTVPHITLLCCNNLNPVTLLPSVASGDPHNCFMLTDDLLDSCNDL